MRRPVVIAEPLAPRVTVVEAKAAWVAAKVTVPVAVVPPAVALTKVERVKL